MFKCQNLIKKYVPRHIRLGVCAVVPELQGFQDVIEDVPVVDKSGSVVSSHRIVKSVPVHEVMSKFKLSQFRLSALVRAGVPLKMVNINASNVATIEQLKNVCESLDYADKYVERVLAERKEREAWFNPVDENGSNI